MTPTPETARIVEVGPRDGLQNESTEVTVATRVELVNRLVDTGLRHIEVGSFVSPKWVPQMASSDEVFGAIKHQPGVTYAALTPNMRGYEGAREAAANEVAIFAAASEAFSRKNINCSIAESIERFRPLAIAAQRDGIPLRGYVSCVVGCPYQGEVAPDVVADTAQQLLDLGCYEVSLGDTIGVGTPGSMSILLEHLLSSIRPEQLALHCHDTYGQALANILVGLQHGIATFDSSIAGLGGCPYARGASGNVATEDLVYMLHGMGVDTGINLPALVEVGRWISGTLDRPNSSSVGLALEN